MPSALFVSQCHHFSLLIYFIAISVLLAPSPTLPTTAPPPSLAQHHLHLHLRLRAFATTGFSSFTCLPTADTPPPPRRSSQAFHPGPSVSSTARSLARAASTNTFARNSPPLRNAIPRSPRRSFGFIIPFCPFSFLSSRPDTAVLRSPPPPLPSPPPPPPYPFSALSSSLRGHRVPTIGIALSVSIGSSVSFARTYKRVSNLAELSFSLLPPRLRSMFRVVLHEWNEERDERRAG